MNFQMFLTFIFDAWNPVDEMRIYGGIRRIKYKQMFGGEIRLGPRK